MPNSSHRPVNQPSDLEKLRHSTAHLLAAAVLEIWPDAKPAIGPAIDDGFYYDFEFGQPVSESDFPQIEQKMRQLGKDWSGFERREVSADEAKQQFPDNPYKQQLIDELAGEGQTISLYQSGGFVDLCRGGHVGTPAAEIKHFQLLSVAGAYWRGDEHNPMLTRIYGTVWPSQAELDDYLERQQQAKLRDHRRLGQELELYFIDDLVGKGLIMWLPKGQIIKDEIERLVKEMEAEAGYLRVTTPHIARQELFETSGHLPYY
ncbi:MAG: threonine--tRNA ligase, partial [Candidatus Pacebacteria bacterium CG10_big_fil_rev_8_21_14_0_10_56_10]